MSLKNVLHEAQRARSNTFTKYVCLIFMTNIDLKQDYAQNSEISFNACRIIEKIIIN